MTEQPALNHVHVGEELDLDEIARRVDAGELTNEQAAEMMQQAARREAAERGTSVPSDPDDRTTQGGFGSGQGMEKLQTGQDPPN